MRLILVGVISLLLRSYTMLSLLLVGLVMFGRSQIRVRFILPLALVGLAMADKAWVGQ